MLSIKRISEVKLHSSAKILSARASPSICKVNSAASPFKLAIVTSMDSTDSVSGSLS